MRSFALCLLALLVSCSPAPGAVVPPAASASSAAAPSTIHTPPPASAASASGPAGSAWATFDPNIIRCGIDDHPANVLGLAVLPDNRPRLADRAFPDRSPRAKRPYRPMEMPYTPPAPPRLEAQRLDPWTTQGKLSPELQSALAAIDPQYDVCMSLATEGYAEGKAQFELELNASGAPVRVTPVEPAAPDLLLRCLMERACQYQVRAPLGATRRVRLPVRLFYAQPLPPSSVAGWRARALPGWGA